MNAKNWSLLLVLFVGACAAAEPVKMDTGRIIPSDSGKCQQMVGGRTINVECQPGTPGSPAK